MADDTRAMAQRWAQRMAQSGDKVRQGVANVQESPTEAAAAAYTKWQNGVMQAGDAYQRGLRAVSKADWQKAMTEKGIPRMATGAQMAESKVANFLAEFMPVVRRVQAEVKAMPSETYEQRIERMLKNANELHQFSKSR